MRKMKQKKRNYGSHNSSEPWCLQSVQTQHCNSSDSDI